MSIPPETTAESGMSRRAASFAFGTFFSRLTGFGQLLALAWLFPKEVRSAYFFALRIPSTLRGPLAEGALNAIFVPVFTEYMNKGVEEGKRAVRLTFTAAFLLLLVVTTAGCILAPYLVYASGGMTWLSQTGDPVPTEMVELTFKLTRMMFPFLLFVGLAAVSSGILFSQGRFGPPGVSPCFINTGVILSAMLSYAYSDRLGIHPAYALTAGALAGALGQLIFLDLSARRRGIGAGFGWDPTHPAVRKVGRLWLPVLVGHAAWQLGLLIDSIMAFAISTGAVSHLMYAARVVQLPQGIFVVALYNVMVQSMSQDMARGNDVAFRSRMHYGARMITFITIPCLVGFMVLGRQIIAFLFEYGAWDSTQTFETALALFWYAPGLFAFGMARPFAAAFYARNEVSVPVRVSIGAVTLNIILNLLLIPHMAQGGLALASSLSSGFNAAALYILYRRRHEDPLKDSGYMEMFIKVACASLIMGIVCFGVERQLIGIAMETSPFVGRAIQCIVPIAAGALVYIGAVRVMKIPELEKILKLLRRKVSE